MQIIETSAFGVRSAVWKFVNPDSNGSILLFPMIHIAEPQFFENMLKRLLQCDVVLYEGVKSPIARRITRSYTQMTKNKKLGLVAQSNMTLESIKDRMVLADLSGEDFDAMWSELTFWERQILPLAALIYGFYLRFFVTRKILVRHLNLELKETREEIMDEQSDGAYDFIVKKRDIHLIKVIDEQIESVSNKDACIGIIYGAEHMRAVIRHLVRHHNYRLINGEWMDVFKL